MRFARRNLLAIVTIAVLVSSGCAAQSATPLPTPSPLPTPVPTLPSYSAVISTYPAGVKMCAKMGDWFQGAMGFNVTCDDVVRFGGAGKKPGQVVAHIGTTGIEVSADVFQDYGVKVEVDVATSLGSTTYPVGAKLTVDNGLNWMQVSSWG